MTQAALDNIPVVDIDKEGNERTSILNLDFSVKLSWILGRFKYVLIKVYADELPDGTEPSKLVVRGNVDAEWHGNYDLLFRHFLELYSGRVY